VCGYIPNRFDEGYGLNTDALDTLASSGVSLVITVDCGVRSPNEAEHARQIGMDLIITDHHQPNPELPSARAVINPKQPDDSYPDKNLAGVGLAYKLAQALLGPDRLDSYEGWYSSPTAEYLDLVALGTVTDMAPLVGENRFLVRAGIQQIRHPCRQGIVSLIGASRLKPQNITAGDISFMLGPRLNAAGRLDSALAALNLLLSNDLLEAGQLAQLLEVQNRERQQITRDIQESAERLALEEDPEALLIFACHPDYNPGVVGLAAARLVDRFYRPALVAQKGDEFTRGSCRSIPEFHITQALDECRDLLIRHGGHAAAAGFTLRTSDLPELQARLKAIASRQLASLDLQPTLQADALLSLSDLHPDLLKDLAWLQPTGHSNPPANFVSRNLRVLRSWLVGPDSSHLKMVVTDGNLTFDAIAFRQGQWQDQLPPRVDLLYSFELNEYNGRASLQLRVHDLKATEAYE
jgi:single-stranded-DNA-specific exonuclease